MFDTEKVDALHVRSCPPRIPMLGASERLPFLKFRLVRSTSGSDRSPQGRRVNLRGRQTTKRKKKSNF